MKNENRLAQELALYSPWELGNVLEEAAKIRRFNAADKIKSTSESVGKVYKWIPRQEEEGDKPTYLTYWICTRVNDKRGYPIGTRFDFMGERTVKIIENNWMSDRVVEVNSEVLLNEIEQYTQNYLKYLTDPFNKAMEDSRTFLEELENEPRAE